MKILVSAESFGYGPIATCLSVIKELKKYEDVSVDFIGSGISLEQAKMSGYFDKYYVCDTYNFESLKKFKDIFKKYNIFFSSENVNGAIFGLKFINNTYYVDNLVWMWDEIPSPLGKVKKFFISEIFPCQENFNRVGNFIENPIFIGPVRDLKTSNMQNKKNQLVINIGGASSFLFEQSVVNEFYNKIINDILSTDEIEKFDSIIICGGSKVIDNIKLEKENTNIKIATLANDKYIKIMSESSHCIMSPGLGNFIETLNKNINIMYLPAVNYSQLLQLQFYDEMKFGFKNLGWNSFDFYKDIPMYLDETTGVNMVVDNIKQFNSGDYRNLINKFIKEYLSTSQENSFELRKEFFNKFNKNASKIIADTIYNENK